MLTILMNHIFVFSIGIFIGILLAFEIFQKQLTKAITEQQFKEYLKELDYGDTYR